MTPSADSEVRLGWRGDWRTTAFTVLFLPLFLALGNWQLQRETEKIELQERFQQRAQEAHRPLADVRGSGDELAYRRVLVEGEVRGGRDFLLDNRMFQGRYGFEVLTPVQLDGSSSLFAASARRQ